MAMFVGQIITSRTQDDNVVNRVHLEHGALDKQGVALVLADAWIEAWSGGAAGTNLKSLAPTTVQPLEVKVYDVGAPPQTPVSVPISSAGAGTGGGSLPHQIACVATLDALTGGRRGRGRMYFGPLRQGVEGQLTGRLTQAAIDIVRARLVAFIATLNAGGVLLVIRSTVDGQGRVVRQVRVDDVFDTQRRRGFRLPTATSESTANLQVA